MSMIEQQRQAAWRIKLIRHAAETTKNGSKTGRHVRISRKTFYKWVARYQSHGEAGLCERPRRPHRSPNATPKEVVSKVLYLRQKYHFGPARIAAYLERYHAIHVAHSTVHRILQRHRLSRLPSNQKYQRQTHRWKRYEKQQPGHRLQVDVKFLERIPGSQRKLYQFTAIDDCTRIRVLKVYDGCNQRNA